MSALLAPEVQVLLERLNATFPALGTEVTDAVVARGRFEEMRRPPALRTVVGEVRDEEIEGPDGGALPLRWYRPGGAFAAGPAATGPAQTAAAVVFLHGGGWVLGGFDSHDELVRKLVAGSGATIVAVDYRLSPEHRFPAALHDAYAAIAHVAQSTGRPVVVAGDSAGANLAAAVSMMARDRGAPEVIGQLLLYPMLDSSAGTRSYRENGSGFYITADHLRWFWRQYLNEGGDAAEPYASPLQAEDLTRLPAAHVVTAELDPLRDEGEQFAQRLVDAGVDVSKRRYAGAFHGFLAFDGELEIAREAHREICRVVATLTGTTVR